VSRRDGDWYGIGGGAVRPSAPTTNHILPNLIVGEYPNIADVPWLKNTLGVDAVICLQDNADLASKRLRLNELRQAYLAQGISFEHVPIPDGEFEFLADRLPGIVELVHRHVDVGATAYLHCNAGMNRAPTAAIAYMHARCGMPLPDAIAFVKARRSCVPYVRALELAYGRA
jgi:protein-tyrosine phosphatase